MSQDIAIDLRGHFHGCNTEQVLQKIRFATFVMEIRCAHPEVEVDRFPGLDEIGDCPGCGETVSVKKVEARWQATEPCAYPSGLPAYSVEIDVPSGQLAFANDLRGFFPLLESFDIGLTIEMRHCTEAFAKQGCIHAFVGNSCPNVRRLDAGTLVVGIGALPGKRVASIGTDLWWMSAADLELVRSRAKLLREELPSDLEAVAVAPGRYRATTYVHVIDRDWRPATYLTIENIGDASDIVPEMPSGADVSFEREVLLARLSYPAIFLTRRSVLEYFFCGTSLRWYDGVLVGLSRRDRALRLLAKAGQVSWDDDDSAGGFRELSEYSALAHVPNDVRPDWLAGARETIRLILEANPAPDREDRVGRRNREVATCIRADLQKRFPDGV